MPPTRNYYVQFFPGAWGTSDNVKQMTMEEVGVYFTLLHKQMIDGYILLNDRSRMKITLRSTLEPILDDEQLDKRLTKLVRDRFVPLFNDPEKFVNERLLDAMDREGKYKKQRERLENQIKSFEEAASKEEEIVFNFTPILLEYPKVKHRGPGWDKGLQMMQNSISTQEDYDRLQAAVKYYRKKTQGRLEIHIKSLASFMTEWTAHIPTSFRAREVTVTNPEVATAKPQVSEQDRPWTPSKFDGEIARNKLAEFWTEERKQRFLNGDDPRNDVKVSANG